MGNCITNSGRLYALPGALLTLLRAVVAKVPRKAVQARVATLHELTIAGRLIAISSRLVTVGRGLVTVGRGLVTVGRGLVTVGRGLVPVRSRLIGTRERPLLMCKQMVDVELPGGRSGAFLPSRAGPIRGIVLR